MLAQGKPLIRHIVSATGGRPGDIVKIITYITSIAVWRAHVS
jgi:hypothetical protein